MTPQEINIACAKVFGADTSRGSAFALWGDTEANKNHLTVCVGSMEIRFSSDKPGKLIAPIPDYAGNSNAADELCERMSADGYTFSSMLGATRIFGEAKWTVTASNGLRVHPVVCHHASRPMAVALLFLKVNKVEV